MSTETARSFKKLRFVIGTGLIVAAIAYLIATAVSNTAEYYMTVSEVRARQAALTGQSLRVAGRVAPGTISWDPQTLTLAFGLIQPLPGGGTDGVNPVAALAAGPSFHVICRRQPKPDMFAPNRDVIVEGRLMPDSSIEARQVLTSCPSKYMPKQPPGAKHAEVPPNNDASSSGRAVVSFASRELH